MNGAGIAVGEGMEFAGFDYSGAAKAPVVFSQQTFMGAKGAVDQSAFILIPSGLR
jgi:hypothetical protein